MQIATDLIKSIATDLIKSRVGRARRTYLDRIIANAGQRYGYLAGTDEQRREAMSSASLICVIPNFCALSNLEPGFSPTTI